MNPKRFVLLGGTILVTIGMAGITGALAAISRAAFFRPPYWINWFHLSLGSVLLGVAVWGSRRFQAGFTLVGSVLGTTLGLLGLLFGPLAARRFNQPDLADRSDHTVHLAVGLTALWGWLGRFR